MKKQLFYFLSIALLSTFFITSCTEDNPLNPGTGNSPSVRLVDAAGFISTSTVAEAGDVLNFRLTASAGDDPLDRLTITENNTTVALTRITYQTGSNFGANPAPIINITDKQGFTLDVMIQAPTSPGNYDYKFEVRDEAGIVSNTTVTVTVELIAPTATLVAPTSAVETGPGSITTVTIDAAKGTANLTTIAVYENGTLLDPNRLAIDGSNFLTNPTTTPATETFQSNIAIEVSQTVDSIPYTYTIEVEDAEGLTASVNVEVLVQNTIDTTYTGVLVYNKDGEQFGGLNLYTGESVAFNSSLAQIRDLGIDLNLPLANNWIQKIRPVNGAVLKVPGDNQAEGFSFENTNSRIALIAAYDNGIEVSQSEKVIVGDVFLVKKDDDYFILQVTEVTVTDNNNNDYYIFSIKKSEGM